MSGLGKFRGRPHGYVDRDSPGPARDLYAIAAEVNGRPDAVDELDPAGDRLDGLRAGLALFRRALDQVRREDPRAADDVAKERAWRRVMRSLGVKEAG